MLSIIVNPVAGGGRTLTNLPQVENLIKLRNIPYEVLKTEKQGDAAELARKCCAKGNEIAAMGGDGTFFEVLNGMNGADNVLYFLPSGTGNDFIKTLDLPNDPVKALEMQLDNEPDHIDYGTVNDLCFMNVSGIGFDVMVLREADRFKKRFHGLVPYLLGLICALRKFKPLRCRLTIDDGPVEEKTMTVLSVGNGQYIGGGMRAVPDADPWSGSLSCVLVDAVKKPQILSFLPKFIKGKHVELPIVKVFKCAKLEIDCPGMTVNLDGELKDFDRAVISIRKKGLTVRCKKPACHSV